MSNLSKDPLFDNFAHLATFPDHILRDIARNDCSQRDYRLHAVEVLTVRKSPMARHPDLRELVDELNIELDGLVFEYPDTESSPGPLTASVTTKTMFSDGLEEIMMPSEPLTAETVLVGDPLVCAVTPEENILRDPEEEVVVVPPAPEAEVSPKPKRTGSKKNTPKDTPADAPE